MKKLIIGLSFVGILLPFGAASAQTLQECQQAAERNYPLIRQYDLIEKTTALTVDNLQKGWLPQISATAQATYQSDVAGWPEQMQAMLRGMGIDFVGLKKDQYRVGIDLNQTLYDGGSISSQKEIARSQGALEAAETAVSLYQVRKRVNEMYFSALLLDENIQLNRDLQELLLANEKKLEAMLKGGTAMECDYNQVKAERLSAVQQETNLLSQRQTLLRVLSVFCGIEVSKPVKPAALSTQRTSGQRPELAAIDARLRLAYAQEKALDAALKPRLGVFAQGYYGYPGLNMFEDMLRHRFSLNGIVGMRLSWNIGALYTRKNDKARIQAQRDMAETSREVFLLNNNIEKLQQNDDILRYRRLMEADNEIINLRQKVRKASESKLRHGIINVSDLVRDINAENASRVQQSIHEIEMLREMYNLDYTIGNE